MESDPAEDTAPIEQCDLATVIATFERWLHLPDRLPLLAVLATVAANLFKGDPIWLLIVGASGSGKSELIQALGRLPKMHPAAVFTEAALLSGVPQRDFAKDAQGGLLREIDRFGFIVMKDFTSTLAQNRDERARTLAALREIYDGSWTRRFGTDGGKKLHWEGKVALIAGVTPAIDSHHRVISTMGERFVFIRVPTVDEIDHAAPALLTSGREADMRAELAAKVAGLFVAITDDQKAAANEIDDRASTALAALATFAAKCRSPVDRDPYRKEIQNVPDAEQPGRLAKVLSRLLTGARLIGASEADCWALIRRIALDSMPGNRRKVIDVLLRQPHTNQTTSHIAVTASLPTATARRALEELTAHKIVTRIKQDNKADLWRLTDKAREWLIDTFDQTVSAMYGPPGSHDATRNNDRSEHTTFPFTKGKEGGGYIAETVPNDRLEHTNLPFTKGKEGRGDDPRRIERI